jgi:intergrase/recombinase
VRAHVLKSLSAVAKYLGRLDEWHSLLRNSGVKWEKRKSLEVFLDILEGKKEEAYEWLKTVIHILPKSYGLALVFQRLTGLRPQEAHMALRIIHEEGYYDQDLSALCHFKFPKLFIRGTKNAFISFVSPRLCNIAKTVGLTCGNNITQKYLERHGYPMRARLLRSDFATQLRNAGIPSEAIDLIQGRISSEVFVRHYYKPALKDLGVKVLAIIELLERELLGAISSKDDSANDS